MNCEVPVSPFGGHGQSFDSYLCTDVSMSDTKNLKTANMDPCKSPTRTPNTDRQKALLLMKALYLVFFVFWV